MSKFFTTAVVCATAIADVLKKLPEKAHVERVRFDPKTQSVVIDWDHHRFVSGKDFHTEFPVQNLEEQKLPAAVTIRVPKRKVTPEPEPEPEQEQEQEQGAPAEIVQTEDAAPGAEAPEALQESAAAGEPSPSTEPQTGESQEAAPQEPVRTETTKKEAVSKKKRAK